MATEAIQGVERSWASRAWHFVRDEVPGEMRKVTWPSGAELKKATLTILVFVVVLGFAIGWFDVALQFVLVRLVARLF